MSARSDIPAAVVAASSRANLAHDPLIHKSCG